MSDLDRHEKKSTYRPRPSGMGTTDHPPCYVPGCDTPIHTYYRKVSANCWLGTCLVHRPGHLSEVTKTVQRKRWDEINVQKRRAVMNNLCPRPEGDDG